MIPRFSLLALLLAACSQEVTCPSCAGDGKQRCVIVGLNASLAKCVQGTVRCDPTVHKPQGVTGFCTTCLGRDGDEHADCNGTGILAKSCEKCGGTGKVRQ